MQTGYEVVGRPIDPDGARTLANLDEYQFRFWAISVLGGQPRGGEEKKGRDEGVDGELYFKLSARRNGRAIISVKAGRDAHPDQIRELIGTTVTQGAQAGIFVCVGSVTADMEKAAASAGFVETPFGRFPRCQIVGLEGLFEKRPIDLPLISPAAAIEEEARQQRAQKRPKVPAAEKLRKQPSFRLPIAGGRATPQQSPLALDEPVLQPPRPARSRQGRRSS
jgi:hypothetical protein